MSRPRLIVVTSYAAALAVVAVLAVAVPVTLRGSVGHDSAPAATPAPGSTTAPPPRPEAEQVIAHGLMYSFAAGPDGEVATLWTSCVHGHLARGCRVAWQLRSGRRAWSGMAHDGDALSAGGAGFVVASFARDHGFVLQYDGTTTPLRRLASGGFDVGDVAVSHYSGARLVDPKLATWTHATDGPTDPSDTAIVAGETTWAEHANAESVELSWRGDNGPWSRHLLLGSGDVTTGPIAAGGGHVAAASATVAVDSDPLAGLSVSSNAGRTWTDLPASALPFGEVDHLVAAGDGSLYVQTVDGGLFRSTDPGWTTYTKVREPSGLADLQALPDGSLAGLVWHGRPVAAVRLRRQGPATLVVARTLATFGR